MAKLLLQATATKQKQRVVLVGPAGRSSICSCSRQLRATFPLNLVRQRLDFCNKTAHRVHQRPRRVVAAPHVQHRGDAKADAKRIRLAATSLDSGEVVRQQSNHACTLLCRATPSVQRDVSHGSAEPRRRPIKRLILEPAAHLFQTTRWHCRASRGSAGDCHVATDTCHCIAHTHTCRQLNGG